MNIIKHLEFFDPANINGSIHIVGVGAIGSTLAEMLARLGIPSFHIWDMDRVAEHNIANQMFTFNDIGELKVNAVAQMCKAINPEITVNTHENGYQVDTAPMLSGYIFLCVDNIELRAAIVKKHMYSPTVKGFFDFRMRLTDAQHYAANNDLQNKQRLLETMSFSEEEAKAGTPVSACGTSLSVVPTIRTVVSAGVANFINFINHEPLAHMILVDPFNGIMDRF